MGCGVVAAETVLYFLDFGVLQGHVGFLIDVVEGEGFGVAGNETTEFFFALNAGNADWGLRDKVAGLLDDRCCLLRGCGARLRLAGDDACQRECGGQELPEEAGHGESVSHVSGARHGAPALGGWKGASPGG